MPRPVEPGSQAATIIEEEERLLADVVARLAAPDDALPGVPTDYDRQLIELRDAIGEAKAEDLAPLVEQMARLSAIASQRGRVKVAPVDSMSPYFGHMRLREDGRERDVLVGKRAFTPRGAAGKTPIVDWRNAPVSRIYYRYEEGDDYDETFEGHHLEGIVAVRRNLAIVNGRLRRIGCPQGTFVRDARGNWFQAEGDLRPTLQGGQGTAARPPRPTPTTGRKGQKSALGVDGRIPRADKHLPEIAALIDREQFDLITQPASGLVLIQGGAGSGKTTVALHRVAYLHFAEPQRFKPKKMLIVVPSKALARYVEGVLPSLGVSGVPVFVYRDWVAERRKKLLPGAGKQYADGTPDAVIRVKKHPALLTLLEDVCARQVESIEATLAAEAPDAIARFRELAGRPIVPRLRKVAAWLGKQEQLAPPERTRQEALVKRLRRRAADVVRDWEETLTDRALLDRGFAGTDVTADELRRTVAWVTEQKSSSPEEEYEGIDEERMTAADGKRLDDDETSVAGRLDHEDDPLLLRLFQIKQGGLIDRDGNEVRYEHISIDEAQDFSVVDLKVLHEATTSQRSLTVAGDTAQRIVFDNDFSDWPSHLRAAGFSAIEIHPLKLSYRSTAEVMRFSREILGPLADPEEPLVARNGAPVELHAFVDTGEMAAFLSDALRSLIGREPTASVAVIARYPEQADLLYGALHVAEVPALRRVRREDFAFSPGIDVTDVAQVKGLEFDYVVIADVSVQSFPETLEARHLLHIAATRAAHQLWLLLSGTPSPLLPKDMLAGAIEMTG
jgi:DNA helicase II / ATP-dependent DNA helicase PcrA